MSVLERCPSYRGQIKGVKKGRDQLLVSDTLITDTSVRRTPVKQTLRVGPCLSLLTLFDSLWDGHLSTMDT